MILTRDELQELTHEQLVELANVQQLLIGTQNDVITHFQSRYLLIKQGVDEAIELINDRA